MNIQRISAANNSSFGARLFLPDGEEVKSFNIYNGLDGVNEVEKIGNPKTDIFVKEFISREDIDGLYDQFAKIEIRNPLFGTQSFTTGRFDRSFDNIEDPENYDVLKNLKKMMRQCEGLENFALRKALLKNTRNAIKTENDFEKMNPVNILNNMLTNAKENGAIFSKGRVNHFVYQSKNLLKEIMYKGISNIDQ